MTTEEFARTIESTLLAASATEKQVEALCREAVEQRFHGVCVSPCRVKQASFLLRGTPLRVVAVAGFPLGTQTAACKAREVAELVELGAHEVDAVMNVGAFLDGRLSPVAAELREVRRAAEGAVLKVILETGYLTPDQVREAASLAVGAGVDFLKTSTGFGPTGATVPDVRVLRQVAGTRCGVKAAGGIRSFDQARSLLAAGATRLGTSAGAQLAEEARRELGEPG
ncbi:MAG: deoxyribose-phosphate aldolase [Deltaproteobacteria bacterium]|nr:deoxyribose-phosphate aldolase [Deltaproteobacteria bacterium]